MLMFTERSKRTFPLDDETSTRKNSLKLEFGAFAVIETAQFGHGRVPFDAQGFFEGPWSFRNTDCVCKGRIQILPNQTNAVIDLSITSVDTVLFNGRLIFCIQVDRC